MNGNGTPERRRPIEREYLATLNAVVSLDKWRAICEKAADAALAGDARRGSGFPSGSWRRKAGR